MESISSGKIKKSYHESEWRDPFQVATHWTDAGQIGHSLLKYSVSGDWWDVLAETGITLLVTREYEHIVMGICHDGEYPCVSYMRMPHPSGLAIDRDKGIVYIASTRNPNQIFDLMPVSGLIPRLDVRGIVLEDHPLVPVRIRFYPGCLYIHDLALIQGQLYANAVGSNSIIRIFDNGQYRDEWWPRCVDGQEGPVNGRNHIQLNSIAAGESLIGSFFSASLDRISARCPGHKNFPVDKRGVIFSGKTREPVAKGLTRPHSARIYNNKVWVDNSGYGEFGTIEGERFLPLTALPGWTRGLCFLNDIAFVGTSRVLQRFSQYAPGLKVDKSICAIHAINIKTGKALGNLTWPDGDQIFAVDWLPRLASSGFLLKKGKKRCRRKEKQIFYSFKTKHKEKGFV